MRKANHEAFGSMTIYCIHLRNLKSFVLTLKLCFSIFPWKTADQAAEALHQAGAITIVSSIPNSSEYAEIEMYKSNLLTRFQELKHDAIALEGKGN